MPPIIGRAFNNVCMRGDLEIRAFIQHLHGMVFKSGEKDRNNWFQQHLGSYTYLVQSSGTGKTKLLEAPKYCPEIGAVVNVIINCSQTSLSQPPPSKGDRSLTRVLMSIGDRRDHFEYDIDDESTSNSWSSIDANEGAIPGEEWK